MAIEAEPNEHGENAGLTGGLFKSVNSFAATLLALAHTRLQLLTTELQEEVQRTAHLLVWAIVALFAGMLALFLGALTIIFVFWDTHRVLAALVMTAVLIGIAVIAALVLRAKLRAKPPLLEDTLAELAKDRDRIRQHV